MRWLPERRATLLVLTILGGALLVVALCGVGARYLTAKSSFVLGVVAATPYVLLAAPVGAVFMLLARQWIGVAAGVLVLALAVSTQLWLYTSDDPPRNAVRIQVMTSNLRLGQADPASLIAAVRRHHVDVLMLEELTATEQQHLEDTGLGALLPHHSSKPAGGGFGTGLWSRYPMSEVQQSDQFTFGLVAARLTVPGVARPVQAVALHVAGPVPQATFWAKDFAKLPGYLHSVAADRATLVGGDFNATPDVVQFRRVLDAGFRDSADQAGAGYTRSFPANRRLPPLIAIDHVLTRNGPVATDVRTVTIKKSDHRALLATVAVPRN